MPITASPWVTRFAPLVPAGPVLDLACGGGRHARLFLGRGHPVTAIDRDLSATDAPGAELIQADLETGAPWPLAERQFAGIVVTNYLWRPLLPRLVEALAPGGVLIYETFAHGNERFGSPRNPDFLLARGELLRVAQGMCVIAYEDGIEDECRVVQRICAARTTAPQCLNTGAGRR